MARPGQDVVYSFLNPPTHRRYAMRRKRGQLRKMRNKDLRIGYRSVNLAGMDVKIKAWREGVVVRHQFQPSEFSPATGAEM